MSTRRLQVSLPGLPKIGLYISLLLLPGGFIGLLLVCWLERRASAGRGGKTRMFYSQMRGWRDLIPGLWRLATSRPQLNLDVGSAARERKAIDPAVRYLSA
jgi:hypothetical protein